MKQFKYSKNLINVELNLLIWKFKWMESVYYIL